MNNIEVSDEQLEILVEQLRSALDTAESYGKTRGDLPAEYDDLMNAANDIIVAWYQANGQ
jgi:hypothetical protein